MCSPCMPFKWIKKRRMLLWWCWSFPLCCSISFPFLKNKSADKYGAFFNLALENTKVAWWMTTESDECTKQCVSRFYCARVLAALFKTRFGCGVARPHNAIIMFGNKVQLSRQLLLTSIEIQMLLNLHLKPFPFTQKVLSSYISTTALHSLCDPRMQDGALSTIVIVSSKRFSLVSNMKFGFLVFCLLMLSV